MAWTFQSIAIVGSGAIGLYYGGRLAKAGENVKFLLRSDYDEISGKGLKVESVDGDFSLPQVEAFRTSAEIGPVDLVIVSWKATANSRFAEVLSPLLCENTRVLTLQNGLGNCEAIGQIVGPERVLGGLCFVCINRRSPGWVCHTAGGRIAMGAWCSERCEEITEIVSRFRAARISAVAVNSLEQSQWEKLVWNIPFNGLSVAEGGVTTDVLLASEEIEHEIRALMAEVIAAAKALQLDPRDEWIDTNIERTRSMGSYRTSSMIDFVEGRDVEVEPIWEIPLRRAQSIGVPMPHLEKLLGRIRSRLADRERRR